MKVEIKTITPEEAERILKECDKHNRPMRPEIVDMYARDMIAGNWKLNGESICISKDGILRDGQHRLSAIVKSGIPIDLVVASEIENGITTYDIGVKRNDRDLFVLEGMARELSTSYVISLTRFLLSLTEGNRKPTHSEIDAFIRTHHRALDTVCRISYKCGCNKYTRNTPFAAALFFALETGSEQGDMMKFVNVVNTGMISHTTETAGVILRNMIIEGKVTAKGSDTERKYSMRIVSQAFWDYERGVERNRRYKDSESNHMKRWMQAFRKEHIN